MPLLLVALELGSAAAALAVLLSCDVAVAERTVIAHPLSLERALPLGLAWAALTAALAVREKTSRGTLERASRALLPLLAMSVVPIHAFLGPPTFAEMLLAPAPLGWAARRGFRELPPSRPRRGELVVLAISLVVATGFAIHALGLLSGFSLGYRDAGAFAAKVENFAIGFKERPELPLFYDHFNPGLALLVPLVPPFGRAGTAAITVVQAFALAACGPLAYGLARRRLKDARAATLVALALLAAPAFTHMNVAYSYGFHPVTLALTALLGAAWAFASGRRVAAAILVTLSWTFEETVAPATFGLGLALALDPRRRKAGALLAAVSLIWFLGVTRVVMPACAGGAYYQLSKFSHLGSSMGEIVLSPLTKPRVFFGTLLAPASFAFLGALLAPWAFQVRARWLLAAAPVLAFACLRLEEGDHVKSIGLHYHTNAMPALLLGLVEATRSAGRRRGRRAAAAGALVAALSGAALFGDAPFGRSVRPFPVRQELASDATALAARIPAKERVVATERLASHLVPHVVLLEDPTPLDASFALVDLDDGFGLSVPAVHRRVRDLRRSGFRSLEARGHLILLSKEAPEVAPLLGSSNSVDSRGSAPRSPVNSFPEAGLGVHMEFANERLNLRWHVDRPTEGDWAAAPIGPDGKVCGDVGPIGSVLRPTYERVANEVFDEERAASRVPSSWILFDYLELDRRGIDVLSIVPR